METDNLRVIGSFNGNTIDDLEYMKKFLENQGFVTAYNNDFSIVVMREANNESN